MQKQTKKHLLITGALAVEWALAFAFAKHFANAVADANWQVANAHDDGWLGHEHRLTALELAHGIEHGRPRPARLSHTRVDPDDLD